MFTYFQKDVVNPSGASTSTTGEPSVALVGDTVLQTGNWYAARSIDNGETWTSIPPSTTFPSIDGGYCCDQRAYYVDSHDITVWLLQYSYSSTTQKGSQRIVVFNGKQDLRDLAWHSYTFEPSMLGFGSGNFLDFPDVAVSADNFHVSANVFDANNLFQGAVRWRMSLNNMRDAVAVSFGFATSSTLLGSTYRFAEGGVSDRVYFAAQKSTSELYVYWHNDSNTWSRVVRSIGTYSNNVATCVGPDGLDWCGRVTGRIRGAFGNSSEVGWIWTSAAHGSRPLAYTRIARFTADDNRTLIAEQDIWSSTLTWAYGAGRSNARGDIGMVFAVGGANSYVHSSGTIFDQYQPWGTGVTTHSMGSGTDGPSANRWGDFFDVHAHELEGNTFIGTGMNQSGGSGGSSNQPRYVWFGRDDDEPAWVTLTVQSTGATAVAITQNVTDMDSLKDGNTTYTRRFARNQSFELEAPQTVTVGGATWEFNRWAHEVSPGGGFSLNTIGELTLDVSTIGSLADTAEARYVRVWTVDIQSTNPASGTLITITPNDVNGLGSGTTQLTRDYIDGEQVTMTAPAAVGFNGFKQWVVDGVLQPLGVTTGVLTVNADRVVVASYWDNVPGTTSHLGQGCAGSTGLLPRHALGWPAGQQGPQQGYPIDYLLSRARPNTAATLLIGLRKDFWGVLPLPLDLTVVGANGCFLHHTPDLSTAVATNGVGRGAFTFTWPRIPAAVGISTYTSFIVLDPGVPRPLQISMSNAEELVIGGDR